MDSLLKEAQIKEAVRRLKRLGIYDEAVRQFEENGAAMSSEPPIGALYTLNDEQKSLVQDFESKWNAKVYFVIRSVTTIGRMDSLLYVSEADEEWYMDDIDIDDGHPFVYVHNYDDPDCSEFGAIAIKKVGGGLIRTA